jgi:D-alanine--poly(phosphoribitol) ligase subunit 2
MPARPRARGRSAGRDGIGAKLDEERNVVDENGIIQRLDTMFVESLQIKVPSPDTDFIESGMVDSLQFVELLLQLEQRFGCRIDIDDIELDDFRTLNSIARLVAARAGRQGLAADQLN